MLRKIKIWFCKNYDLDKKGYVSIIDFFMFILSIVGNLAALLWILFTIVATINGEYSPLIITFIFIGIIYILFNTTIDNKLNKIKVISCPIKEEKEDKL